MKRGLKLPTIFTYLFLVVLTIYFIIKGNYEFIGYAVVVGALYYFILRIDKKYNFPLYVVWMFVLWVVLHLLGGTIKVAGIRLYDTILLPIYNGGGEFVILRYDQFIHAYCYVAIGLLVYYALKKHLKKGDNAALIVFTILSAIGIGLLNEIIEFGLVLFAGASETVGGYYNTALDLVFNFIGAVIAVVIGRRVG